MPRSAGDGGCRHPSRPLRPIAVGGEVPVPAAAIRRRIVAPGATAVSMRSERTDSGDRARWRAVLLLGVALSAALPLLLAGFELWRDRAEIAASGERSAGNLARLLQEQTARTVQAVDLTLSGMIDTLRLTP